MSKKSRHPTLQLHGTLLAYNISPKGHVESATVDTSIGLAQLNFPKHAPERTARGMTVGSVVDLAVQLEHDGGDHPVYVPSDEGDGHSTGTIVRLNYSMHGEINGCHLDDGTFVHLGPEKAKRYELHLGAKITATGSRRAGADAVVLDAKNVKNVKNESTDRAHKARAR